MPGVIAAVPGRGLPAFHVLAGSELRGFTFQEHNKQSSKPNFTNFASELLKDCQRDLSERGKKMF